MKIIGIILAAIVVPFGIPLAIIGGVVYLFRKIKREKDAEK